MALGQFTWPRTFHAGTADSDVAAMDVSAAGLREVDDGRPQ